ncbi:MAG: dethiobiotin synthase [Planctomycetota bacterium]|jgi:dethiobiotin synthetase
MKKPTRGFFITGTDTDVGKTFVACKMLEQWRLRGERVGAYKPAASGAASAEESDAYRLWLAIDRVAPLDWVNPQSFRAPLAPPIAAEAEQRVVDDPRLLAGVERWSDRCDVLLVEGAGGLLSPISWTMTNADLAREIGYPLVIVARNRLGVVHQILATVVAAQDQGLAVAEIVLNDTEASEGNGAMESNQRLLEPFLQRRLPGVPVRREPYRATVD